MVIDFGELTIVQWILTGLLVIVGASSSVAAWYGAVLSRKNQKRLQRQESVVVQVSADHHELWKPNGTRNVEDERVKIRFFNKGRPLQIEAVVFLARGLKHNLPRSFANVYKDWTVSSKPLELETHKTVLLELRVTDLLALEDLACEKKPARIRLSDGEMLDLKCKPLVEIIEKLRAFKSDLDNGYDLLLPSITVWVGSQGKSVEGWEGEFPPEALFRYRSGPPSQAEPIPAEDEAAFRAGRNPQRERLEAARSKKR